MHNYCINLLETTAYLPGLLEGNICERLTGTVIHAECTMAQTVDPRRPSTARRAQLRDFPIDTFLNVDIGSIKNVNRELLVAAYMSRPNVHADDITDNALDICAGSGKVAHAERRDAVAHLARYSLPLLQAEARRLRKDTHDQLPEGMPCMRCSANNNQTKLTGVHQHSVKDVHDSLATGSSGDSPPSDGCLPTGGKPAQAEA